MVRKIFIFLIFVFCTLLFAVISFAADNNVTDDKPADVSHTLKGSDPAQGVIIGEPVTQDQMLLNPVKKKKRVQKQEDIKEKK